MSNPQSRQKPITSTRRGKKTASQPARWAVQFYYDPRTQEALPHPGSDPAKTADIILRFRRNVEDDNAWPALQEVLARAAGRIPPVDSFLICFGRKGKYVREDLNFACSALIAQLTEGREFAEVTRKSFILSGYLTKAPEPRQAQESSPSALPEVPPTPADTPAKLTPEQARAELDAILAAIQQPRSHFTERLRALLDAAGTVPPELADRIQVVRGLVENLPETVEPRPTVPTLKPAHPTARVENISNAKEVLRRMDQLETELAGDQQPMVEKVQSLLHQLAGQSWSYDENVEIAARVNALVKEHGLRLLHEDDPVTIYCMSPDRYKNGCFHARTSTKKSATVYTKITYPPLRVLTRSAAPIRQ